MRGEGVSLRIGGAGKHHPPVAADSECSREGTLSGSHGGA